MIEDDLLVPVDIGIARERGTAMSEPDVAADARTEGARDALRLPGGRVLAWSRLGPDPARPVIFCTGAGMSGSLGFGLPALPALGLQLVAIDRPGLGRSSPHPTKTLQTWSDDVAYLMTSRGLHDGLAVGFSQGAPFALALAGAGLVGAVAVVAGQDEFRAVSHLLHPEVAAMLASAEADPDGFERTIARDATADWLWSLPTVVTRLCDAPRLGSSRHRIVTTPLRSGSATRGCVIPEPDDLAGPARPGPDRRPLAWPAGPARTPR